MNIIYKKIGNIIKKEKQKADKVKRVALSRAVKTVKSKAIENIRRDYNIKKSDLLSGIKMKRVNATKISLSAMHRAMGLIKYNARQTKKGVTFSVKKGKREFIASAFITQVGVGRHIGVFKRKGKERLPIQEKYGASVKQLFSSRETEEIMVRVFRERFKIELERAIKYVK